MITWNPANRPTSSLPSPSEPATRNTVKPEPTGSAPVDTFSAGTGAAAPEGLPTVSPTGGSQAISGYDHPIDARELPDPGNGTGVLTYNLANGNADKFRTPGNRQKQADLIREAGASVVGFQEVDVGVDRTGNVNTALDVVRRFNPAFENAQPTRKGSDGTTFYETSGGTLVEGESFSGDDRGGVAGDKGADATYGNAMYVGPPNKVVDAYTVALPDGASAPVASEQQLAALADGTLTDAERDQLGQTNEANRRGANREPRTALVTRVVGPDGKEKTFINTHLDSKDGKVREAQLKYLAKIVAAESKGPPSREVVVMGDFNDSTANVGKALEGVGLHRVVGGKKDTLNNFDQLWVSNGVDTQNSAQIKTASTTDHPHAGYTVLT